MNYSFNGDWRTKRNINYMNFTQNYPIMHHSISHYCSETKTDLGDSKTGLNDLFGSDSYLNHLNMLPNPLQKNLADALPVIESKKPEYSTKINMTAKHDRNIFTPQNLHLEPSIEAHSDSHPALSSIGNFLTGVFNVISGVIPSFARRAKTPTEGDKNGFHLDSSPNYWQESNMNEQNKNYCNHGTLESVSGKEDVDKMSSECHTAVLKCEDKINRVKSLLNSKCVVPKSSPKPRRPKKLFVPPNSVEENVIEPFVDDDIDRLANEDSVDYVSPLQSNDTALTVAAAMKIEVKTPKTDTIETKIEENGIVDDKPNVNEDTMKQNKEIESTVIAEILSVDEVSDVSVKAEVIQSCEDKLSRLKSLLADRRKKNTKLDIKKAESTSSIDTKQANAPKTIKINCKTFKNPHRTTDKRPKCQIKSAIEEGMYFGEEIDLGTPPSVENLPRISFQADCNVKPELIEPSPNDCYFNEVKGKFHSSSTPDSEDSFQIVFNDSKNSSPRTRMVSDCDSEDSFIIFEDSPDSCYISTDVFGEPSDLETDYESEESDSGHCSNHLGLVKPELSRTVSDLTDDSLYAEELPIEASGGEDEVDKSCTEIPIDIKEQEVPGIKGVLINDRRRLERKNLQPKKVTFSQAPPQIKVMRVWTFAARQARAGHWEQHVVDRDRFKRRIADVDMAISWVLKPQHRSRIKFQRFMPWWHAQRRKEIADKKIADEELKKAEEELKRVEEELKLAEELNSVSDVADDSNNAKDLKIESNNANDLKVDSNNGEINGDIAGVSGKAKGEDKIVNNDLNKKNNGKVSIDNKVVKGVQNVDLPVKDVNKIVVPVKGVNKVEYPVKNINKFVKNNNSIVSVDKKANFLIDKKQCFNNDKTLVKSTQQKKVNETINGKKKFGV